MKIANLQFEILKFDLALRLRRREVAAAVSNRQIRVVLYLDLDRSKRTVPRRVRRRVSSESARAASFCFQP